MKPSLCLNMIVKNEAARIERCLVTVLPHVKAVAILDTGSTDDTKEIIQRVCEREGVPYVIAEGPFENFSQARNLAFKLAKDTNGQPNAPNPWCQFALLVDADMELVVEDPDVFLKLDGTAFAYDVMQRGGAVSYANRRIANLQRVHDTPYVGVTHEYFDAPAAGLIEGARFVDHADGANRVNKYSRDAQLLNDALKLDPTNGRYWYYLGNTYREAGDHVLAIDAYEQRITLGGWDEETHSAMMNVAHEHHSRGDTGLFVSKMLEAYAFRPRSAEPLYELAKYFRELGKPETALVFAKAGLNKKRPNDILFVNDWVYLYGLRFEYSVSGYYDDEERARAFEITDDLALDPECLDYIRETARNNLFWGLKPLSHYCASFNGKQLDFTPPDGHQAMNPSVTVHGNELICNIRCVNYKIDDQGRYMIGPKECGDAPIETRNFIVSLDADLVASSPAEIIWHRPAPAWDMVIGLEDIRLNSIRGKLYGSATVREQLASGQCQMWHGEIKDDISPAYKIIAPALPISDGTETEKNWSPMQGTNSFMYKPGIVRHADGTAEANHKSKVYVEPLRGSSQLIPFKNGWLAVIHEAAAPHGKRVYWHRFVWYSQDGALQRVSKPFVFYDSQIEFCAGMAHHPNGHDIVISFGVRDAEAHIATVDATEVSRMLALYWT